MSQAAPTPRVSVVIPTWRRPALLRRCLDALRRQTLPADQMEIIVCDDGPDEDTRSLVQTFARADDGIGELGVHYVPVHATQGPAGARNCGWQHARADIVAFTDDDTEPDRDWLINGLAAMRPPVAAVSGRVVMPLPDPPTDYALNESGLTTAEFVTANCFVRRDALAAVGGFDERFTLAWREDSDLQFKLLRQGHSIARAPEAVVVHPLRPAPPGISVRQQRKVYFDALLYRNDPVRYRRHIRARPPWTYVAIVACLLLMPVAALARQPWLFAGALLVWAALTLAFAWRRLRRTSRAPAHVLEMLWTSAAIPPLSVYWRLLGAWRFRVAFL